MGSLKTIALVLLSFLIVASSASAFQLNAPERFLIAHPEEQLNIIVINNVAEEQSLSIQFRAPVYHSINAPEIIAANTQRTIPITLRNLPYAYNSTYIATLEVTVGNETQTKTIALDFVPPVVQPEPQPQPQPEPQPEPAPQPQPNIATGLAAFFASPGIELALQVLLAVVIIILCIAIIARVYNWATEQKA